MFARGNKSQTLVRMERGKTSHRQFPDFEKQGSEETDVAESQRSESHILLYMIKMKGTEAMTPDSGGEGRVRERLLKAENRRFERL